MKSWFSIKKSRLRPCIVGPVGSLGQIITSAIGFGQRLACVGLIDYCCAVGSSWTGAIWVS